MPLDSAQPNKSDYILDVCARFIFFYFFFHLIVNLVCHLCFVLTWVLFCLLDPRVPSNMHILNERSVQA